MVIKYENVYKYGEKCSCWGEKEFKIHLREQTFPGKSPFKTSRLRAQNWAEKYVQHKKVIYETFPGKSLYKNKNSCIESQYWVVSTKNT